LESIFPIVSSPPVLLFTCQVTTVLVPPETDTWNCVDVTIFTETVAGEIVTPIPVTGSTHEAEEVEVVVVAVVVEHTTAVLAAGVL
jgi:hypothetical protein